MDAFQGVRAICSAPGKVILFGEHAVVYGYPAIATVTDQRTTVEADRIGERFAVNGHRVHERYHSYLKTALEILGSEEDPIRLQTVGGVPSASGTGSSAALSVAASASILSLDGEPTIHQIAKAAFRVERITQGSGSPTDTSTSAAGGAIAISSGDDPPGIGDPLWDVEYQDRTWAVERIQMPQLSLLCVNSGTRGHTATEVAKVQRAVSRNRLMRDCLAKIGDVTREGAKALERQDLSRVGELMDEAHQHLCKLGVGTPELQKIVDLAHQTPGTLGAKITGAGGGGSILILTETPRGLATRMSEAGFTSYHLKIGGDGVRLEDHLPGTEVPRPAQN